MSLLLILYSDIKEMVLPKCKCWGHLEPWQVYPAETGTFREMEPHGHTTKLEKAEEKDPPPIQSAAIQSAAHPLRESNSGGHQWDKELGNTVLRCQPLRFRTRGVMHGSESKQTDNCGLPFIPLSLGLLFFITLFPILCPK